MVALAGFEPSKPIAYKAIALTIELQGNELTCKHVNN